MAKIWLRGDYLLNAQLPLCPPERIVTFNIAKMVAYAKSKGVDGYPYMTYECWRYLAMNKLQLNQDMAEMYFDVARDFCKTIPTLMINNRGINDSEGDKRKRRVPLLGFAVFLFMQQANWLNLRASMSGLERRPRAYSESEGRGRRSSIGGSLGNENVELKIMEFLMTNLQALLELLPVYDSSIEDYHMPKSKGDTLTMNCLVALDLILEGHTSSDSLLVAPFSAIATTDLDGWTLGAIRTRSVEDFIRKNFQTDPYAVAVPYSDSPLAPINDGPTAPLKRASSETGLSPILAKMKLNDAPEVSPRCGKIVHNAKVAPKSHRIVIVNCIHRQTVGKSSEIVSNSVVHVGRCSQANLYLFSPLKAAIVRRCRGTTIVLGPTTETIRLQNCYDCAFVVMCGRLILIDCQRCTIYVKTPNRPLIFGSTSAELTFAPYCSWYGDLEKQMIIAGIATKPDHWKDPLALGNGDVKLTNKDASGLFCWRLMSPKDYYPISIPFRVPGGTKSIPGGLPDEYKRALEERQSHFNEWNEYVASLDDEERQLVKDLVEKEYSMWLANTGRMEELQQLKMVEARQRKKQMIK